MFSTWFGFSKCSYSVAIQNVSIPGLKMENNSFSNIWHKLQKLTSNSECNKLANQPEITMSKLLFSSHHISTIRSKIGVSKLCWRSVHLTSCAEVEKLRSAWVKQAAASFLFPILQIKSQTIHNKCLKLDPVGSTVRYDMSRLPKILNN